MLLDKTNSVRTCVAYGRTPNGQTRLLQWDSKLQRNRRDIKYRTNVRISIEKTRLIPREHTNVQKNAKCRLIVQM